MISWYNAKDARTGENIVFGFLFSSLSLQFNAATLCTFPFTDGIMVCVGRTDLGG